MHLRILDTALGPLPVRLEHGLSRSPTQWRAVLAMPVTGLQQLRGAIGSTEDSAMDNLWSAVEALAGSG